MLAVVGVLFALATVRPRRWLPVWLVRWSLWPLATFMVLRGMLGIIGDVQQIASGESGPLTHTRPVGSGLVGAAVPDLGSAVGSDCSHIYPPRSQDQTTSRIGGAPSAYLRACSRKPAQIARCGADEELVNHTGLAQIEGSGVDAPEPDGTSGRSARRPPRA